MQHAGSNKYPFYLKEGPLSKGYYTISSKPEKRAALYLTAAVHRQIYNSAVPRVWAESLLAHTSWSELLTAVLMPQLRRTLCCWGATRVR